MTERYRKTSQEEYRKTAGSAVSPHGHRHARGFRAACHLVRISIAILALSLQPALHAEPTRDSSPTRTLPGDVIFEQFGESSGLASQVVSAFAEDGDGFIWIGSQGGLQRWDGYRLSTYKTQLGVAGSLPDDLTQVLHTDPARNLWVGSSSGGLARYDRKSDKFVLYRSSANGLAPVNVEAIEDDGRGGLWIGSGTGLDHLDTVTGIFTHLLPTDSEGVPVDLESVQALRHTADGALWIGTNRGLLRSAPGALQGQLVERVQMPDHLQDPFAVQSIFADPSGTIWAGTDHGIYLIDPSSYNAADAFQALANATPAGLSAGASERPVRPTITGHRPPAGSAIPGALLTSRIVRIAADIDGNIWLGTEDQGLFVVTPSTWAVRHIFHDPAQPTSLADDWVEDLFLSRQGIMWIGSRHGVNYIDTLPKGIVTLLGGESSSASIRDSDIYSVLARPDGTVWLGLSKHGLDILDPSGSRIGELRPSSGSATGDAPDSLQQGTVGALREAADGGVYVVTQHGLYHAAAGAIPSTDRLAAHGNSARSTYSPKLKRLPIGAGAAEGLFQVLPDRDAKGHEFLWLGGTNGLWTFDPSVSGPAVRAKLSKPLTDPRIRVLHRGADHSIWIGTLNGLNRLDIATGNVETIPANPNDPEGLGAGMIATLLTDRRGRLWVGTFTGGIDVLQGADAQGRPRFHRIMEGLPNDNVDCLLEADDGKIWASTDGGIAVIDPFSFEIRVLSRAEGAFIGTYWDGVGSKSPNGDLFFGGSGGLTRIRPSLVKPWTYAAPVVVTSARIGSVDVPLSRFNSGPDEAPIWIGAEQNNLAVEFAALDYTAPARDRYEYKLDGFDHDWVAADPTHRVARYTNLPPGRYTLLLRGSNRDGVWAPARKIRILVLPTWYQQAWFRIFAFLFALLVLFGVFLLATAYMRRQQRELERQVALRTAELEQKTVELKQSQQKLEHMAYTDSLTGLPNRRMFTEHFRRLLALKRRQQGSFALLLMDFDDFKSINDTYGHDAGDAVLKEMAVRMSAVVRESDCLARLGGDEYGLILGQSPDAEATEMVCQKIIESFTEPILFRDVELRTSPSVGVALYPYDGKTQDALYKTADIALYDAKRGGGNSYSWSPGSAPRTQLQ